MKTLKKVSIKVQRIIGTLPECQSRMPISSFLGWMSSFWVMPGMSSLRAFFRKKSSLLFSQKGNFIFVGERNITFANVQKHNISMYFFDKDHLSFSVRKKSIIFSGKRNAIFSYDIRKITFQCNFFGKTIFSEHFKNISFFLRKIIFHLPPNIIFSGKKISSFLMIQERSYSIAIFLER